MMENPRRRRLFHRFQPHLQSNGEITPTIVILMNYSTKALNPRKEGTFWMFPISSLQIRVRDGGRTMARLRRSPPSSFPFSVLVMAAQVINGGWCRGKEIDGGGEKGRKQQSWV